MNKLDSRYQGLLKEIIEWGVEKKDRTGTGTLSVFGRQIHHNMKDGFPLLTTKKMAFKTMVTELLWFLRGSTNIRFLWQNNCSIWDGDWLKHYETTCSSPYSLEEMKKFALAGDKSFDDSVWDLGPIYGKQWRSWTKKKMYLSTDGSYENIYDDADQTVIDQISILISELKTNPDSRRLMVSAWNVGELDAMILPPCHYGFQMYTRELSLEEKIQWVMKNTDIELDNLIITEEAFSDRTPKRAISLMWNQRSCDLLLGIPFNIASYGLLLEIIAKEVNMVPDQLIGNLGDVHLYNNHIEQAKEQLTRTPYELPTIKIENEVVWKEYDCLPSYKVNDFTLENYQSHPAIKAPLSN